MKNKKISIFAIVSVLSIGLSISVVATSYFHKSLVSLSQPSERCQLVLDAANAPTITKNTQHLVSHTYFSYQNVINKDHYHIALMPHGTMGNLDKEWDEQTKLGGIINGLETITVWFDNNLKDGLGQTTGQLQLKTKCYEKDGSLFNVTNGVAIDVSNYNLPPNFFTLEPLLTDQSNTVGTIDIKKIIITASERVYRPYYQHQYLGTHTLYEGDKAIHLTLYDTGKYILSDDLGEGRYTIDSHGNVHFSDQRFEMLHDDLNSVIYLKFTKSNNEIHHYYGGLSCYGSTTVEKQHILGERGWFGILHTKSNAMTNYIFNYDNISFYFRLDDQDIQFVHYNPAEIYTDGIYYISEARGRNSKREDFKCYGFEKYGYLDKIYVVGEGYDFPILLVQIYFERCKDNHLRVFTPGVDYVDGTFQNQSLDLTLFLDGYGGYKLTSYDQTKDISQGPLDSFDKTTGVLTIGQTQYQINKNNQTFDIYHK